MADEIRQMVVNKLYCKFRNFREGFIFAKLHICEVFMKIRTLRNCEITLSSTGNGKT